MNRIKQDIAENKYSTVYLLYGDEVYLRNQYKDNLRKALVAEGDTMNVANYEGKGLPTGEVIDLAETMPFLAEKRVIFIDDSGLFAGGDGDSAFCDYMKTIPESTCIIFTEEKVDKRSKLFKAVKASGYAAEFNRLSSEDIKRWLFVKLKKEGKQIGTQAFEEFVISTGDDMLVIQSEFEKLMSYTYGKNEITLADVREICTPRVEDKIFTMLDHMVAGRTDMALELYGDLLALREAPARILFMIQRQVRMLLHIKQLRDEHKSPDEMARILGANPYAVKKTIPQADRTSRDILLRALDLCAQTEEDAKSGRIDEQIGVELIIVSIVM